MDVVWLKKDVRLHDHGPLWEASRGGYPFCVVYMYEPDQLGHKSVHGSHVCFGNEGLKDLEGRLRRLVGVEVGGGEKFLTLCEGEATEVLGRLHGMRKVRRLLAHEETGHWASYERDKRVRRWCREEGVTFVEFPQMGVTRGLKDRRKFSSKYNTFMGCEQHPTPTATSLREFLLRDLPSCGVLGLEKLSYIAREHAVDRPNRQKGGESEAVSTFESFLRERGRGFSRGVSSPNSAWTSCSRLSPYVSFGHISIRRLVQTVKKKQQLLREKKKEQKGISSVNHDGGWLRSLTAFHSRLRWRSHFIQKMESEPEMEHRAQCATLDHLRAQPGDWREDLYQKWAQGRTGFPMVDACMRCLHQHGWLNFRMRAMLVSFACYNLWLDWKRIAPHLARLFLDYEPGIHYPQLQMQAGVTGINTMRVYSVSKQAKDQDPEGTFIRKYVPELQRVPTKYIHEPRKMPAQVQSACGVFVRDDGEVSPLPSAGPVCTYPRPIVCEESSAKRAKQTIQAIRSLPKTKAMANEVLEKHGSRRRWRKDTAVIGTTSSRQLTLQEVETPSLIKRKQSGGTIESSATVKGNSVEPPVSWMAMISEQEPKRRRTGAPQQAAESPIDVDANASTVVIDLEPVDPATPADSWTCSICTFINDKPLAPVCEMCEAMR